MKLNKLRIINAGFFLITLAFSVLISLINKKLFDCDIILILAASFVADAVCFYRFNNGIIAILRSKFNKPSKKNLRFVDYENIDTKQKDEIISKICDNSIVAYKLNTRTVFQIIKEKDYLRLHRVKSIQNSFIDKNNKKQYKSDIFLPNSSIKGITYSISSKNFDLPIITIYTGKKYYRFIGMLEEFTEKDIVEFFSNITKVKLRNNRANNEKIIHKAEICRLKYNILSMLGIVFTPQLLLFSGNLENKFQILISFYRLISISVLIILALLPIVKNQKYEFSLFIPYRKNDNKIDISTGYIWINITLALSSKLSTEINFTYSMVLTLILTFVSIAFYLIKTNILDDKNKFARILLMSIIVFISSNGIINNINYLVPIKTDVIYCSVIDKEIRRTKNSEDYYLTVTIADSVININVSDDVYNNNPNTVKVRKTKGILGIEYAGYIE
ncbi:MAG: hypothetical protein NC213_02585 [Acetobacter sp.]|nr:hypothetical protein [Bacteroides sp.]MCM1340607.1 hypothetical protein [Acetobacter sp.]MCM1433347.1 hypothetical protein [Clostridiales bacterium]